MVEVPVRRMIEPEALALLEVIDSSVDEHERERAIEALAARRDGDASRMLIEAFERSMWRTTKVTLLRALGTMGHQRATEWLIRVAEDRRDYAMGSEAVLALGSTHDFVAGEFLRTIVHEHGHPLRREAVLALAQMPSFPCEGDLLELLSEGAENLAPGLVQNLLLALGRRGVARAWGQVARYLQPGRGPESIFHAALVAAGELGAPEALEALSALDTSAQFFANELRLTALERCRTLQRTPVEAVIGDVLAAANQEERWIALRTLRSFPPAEAWSAFELLVEDAAPEVECLVRCVAFEPERAEGDLVFLSREEVDLDSAAALLARHIAHGNRELAGRLFAGCSRKLAIGLMARVREESAPERLSAIIGDPAIPRSERMAAVQSLVAQAHMRGRQSALAFRCGELLLEQVERVEEHHLAMRLARALGQVGHGGEKTLGLFERMLRRDPDCFPSIYRALVLLDSPEASGVIARRLRRIRTEPSLRDEVAYALSALSKVGALPDISALEGVSFRGERRRRQALLLILSHNRCPGFERLIADELAEEGDFAMAMLALAAARLNHDDEIWERVFGYLESANPCLSGRALDSICTGGELKQHLRLFELLDPLRSSKETLFKVFTSLDTTEDSGYQRIVAQLDTWLEARQGVMADRDVAASAVSLRDSLCFQRQRSVMEAVPEAERHIAELDQKLAKRLPGFLSYSEEAKSALRNAELTFQHPAIFGERVDKSTIVVELVKAIDLNLQHRIGPQLFGRAPHATIAKMQSRVVQLELDDEQKPPYQLVKDLELVAHFEEAVFPSYKLAAICQGILSGKIYFLQHRLIDGLRAWALLLLIFGRRFEFRGMPIEPLIEMEISSPELIGKLAFELNSLQDHRNEAAHRGTMLRASEFEEIRHRSFGVLEMLDRAVRGPLRR